MENNIELNKNEKQKKKCKKWIKKKWKKNKTWACQQQDG